MLNIVENDIAEKMIKKTYEIFERVTKEYLEKKMSSLKNSHT